MGIVEDRKFQALGAEDPDDYRPNTEVAFVIDPTASDGQHVRSLSLLFEVCAPGDFVPIHTHEMDEAIVIDEGEALVILGDERRTVQAGTVVFIPAGVKHAFGNPGANPLRAHGVFPSDVIDITYLERNPAPGTEGQAPQPPLSINLREL